jgi:hypothetical protein
LEGLNLSFNGLNLSFDGSNLFFDGSNLSFRYIYRITNKTNTSNNTKIVLTDQKRHLGRLTRPTGLTQEEYQRGKEKQKKTETPKIITGKEGVNYKFS